MPTLQNRFRGCLLGLATGDALGTTLEFKYPGTFEPINDIIGGGPFALKAGQWTDDTSMAICLAESLLLCRGMNLSDQCDRYVAWWLNGENSVIGTCFDIGSTVCSALCDYRESGNPKSGPSDKYSAGNGSIMRLAPVPLFYYEHPLKDFLARCEESSLTTHGASEALWSCRALGLIIRQALSSQEKREVMTFAKLLEHPPVHAETLSSNLQEVVGGSWSRREPPQIAGTGYVVRALEAALWAFGKAKDFQHGALLAANLGEDADTTTAIYGQIAGAFWGEEGIPRNWLHKLAWREKISDLADELFQASKKPLSQP